MLINLNDIISAKWMGTFLKDRTLTPLSPIQKPEWHLITSSEDGETEFSLQGVASKLKEISNKNIELILYLDVSDQINHAYRTMPNEYLFLQSINALVIRINAPNRNELRLRKESNTEAEYNKIKNHLSEIDLDDIEFEHIIYNNYI
jgi:hypothetical protein